MLRILKFIDNGNSIEFEPVKGMPGFSYRVIINDVPVDWHGNHERVSAKSARFFLDKHRNDPKCQRRAS
jgi:hypothetical protein